MTKTWQEEFYNKFTNHGEFVYLKGSIPATCGDIIQFITDLRKQDELELINNLAWADDNFENLNSDIKRKIKEYYNKEYYAK